MRACQLCGAEFEPHRRAATRQKFCSDKCSKKAAPSYNRGRMNRWTERPCLHCEQVFQRTSTAGGARRYCSVDCKRLAVRARAKAQRWRHVARRYGVTPAAFDEMLASQGGLCAICPRPLVGRALDVDAPQVDHDHTSGKLRAILCRSCNTALGMFRDDADLVERAAEYLRFWALVHEDAAGLHAVK